MSLFENQQGRMQTPVSDKQVVTEITEEFSLPDYQPEMKRLLRVRATVMPPDHYIGAGNVECTGGIDYSILYAGNDGSLYCTDQSGSYRFVSPVELPADVELSEGLLCDVDGLAEQVTGRVIAPRRLSVKCRLRSNVRVYGQRVIGGDLPREEDSERLCGEREAAAVFFAVGDELELADEILCDEETRELRVIAGEGQIFLTEAAAGSGCVSCRGELVLKLLGAKERGDGKEEHLTLVRRLPFQQSVAVDGVEVNCEACAAGICRSLRITVEEGRILCEAAISLRVKAMRNQRVTFVRDLYSTRRSCETAYSLVSIPRAIRAINGNLSLNTTVTAESLGIRSGMEVVDVCGTAVVGMPEQERGRYRMNGRCRFHMILTDGDEFSSQELELPFKYEIDGGKELPTDCDITADVVTCRARMDGERIAVDAELALMVCLRGAEEQRVLSDAHFGEAWRPRAVAYTVCYPSREDTLWSVAKRYHCRMSELAERNRLPAAPAADAKESLGGVKYLLIT